MSVYEIFRLAHISVGVLALASFWSAGLARKGGKVHIAAGRLFLLLMVGIALSSLPLVARRFVNHSYTSAWFFVHLLVLVSLVSYIGWRAIRDKRDWRRYTGPVYRGLAVLVLLSGTTTTVLGLVNSNAILIAFGVLGPFIGVDMLRFARRGPEAPNWWMVQHYRAMIGNGIATHIAFLLIGLPRLLPNASGAALTYAGWLVPLAIGLGLQFILDRRHRRPALVRSTA